MNQLFVTTLVSLLIVGSQGQNGYPPEECRDSNNWHKKECLSWMRSHRESKKILPNTNSIQPRIIGGTNADIGKYPYFSKPRVGKEWGGCGAILIASKWILTAAHCVGNSYYEYDYEIGALCHSAETGYSNGNCGQFSEVISSINTIIHPFYVDGDVDYDFALVELKKQAVTKPVNIDLGGFVKTYDNEKSLIVIGFGDTNKNYYSSQYPGRLQEVELKFVKDCYEGLGILTNRMFCAAEKDRDSCFGDSGGPIIDQERNLVVGLVSWGIGCSDNRFPGVYAKISSVASWIAETTCDNSADLPSYCDYSKLPTSSPIPTQSPSKSLAPSTICYDIPNWYDSYYDRCDSYKEFPALCSLIGSSNPGMNNLTAVDACCVCGGGHGTPPDCESFTDWFDFNGDPCEWYETPNECKIFGDIPGIGNYTAKEACCRCGGGTEISSMPSVSISPPSVHSTQPSIIPSFTASPSDKPSTSPSLFPSKEPSDNPSNLPSVSVYPSVSSKPSSTPSISQGPSVLPTAQPTQKVVTSPFDIPNSSSSSKPCILSSCILLLLGGFFVML